HFLSTLYTSFPLFTYVHHFQIEKTRKIPQSVNSSVRLYSDYYTFNAVIDKMTNLATLLLSGLRLYVIG
ncbi:hypothetical protein L9F63_015763, partial [Diploptera punctata]